jgi:hypothetical protein
MNKKDYLMPIFGKTLMFTQGSFGGKPLLFYKEIDYTNEEYLYTVKIGDETIYYGNKRPYFANELS